MIKKKSPDIYIDTEGEGECIEGLRSFCRDVRKKNIRRLSSVLKKTGTTCSVFMTILRNTGVI